MCYTSERNVDKIQRLQNRAVRIILGNFNYINVRGIDLVKGINVMNVRQRRDYFMALLVFKCIHGLVPEYLANEVTMALEVSSRITRNVNENDLYVPFVNVEMTKNSFKYQGPIVWNNMPNALKECTSLYGFKQQAKIYFMNCTYV